VGSGFEPHWRPQPAKLPSFGGYSLETLPYLTLSRDIIRSTAIAGREWTSCPYLSPV